jgi:uncharacterized membrane protein YjfL (UPF0719 family)
MDLRNYMTSILISLCFGIVGLFVVYKIFDVLTPELDFPKELAKGNMAVAVFLAGLFIGLGLLLGSAIK